MFGGGDALKTFIFIYPHSKKYQALSLGELVEQGLSLLLVMRKRMFHSAIVILVVRQVTPSC